MQKKICELFAGVGGFRLGFVRLESGWETVWFSQWEPGAKKQWAHDCYVGHFGDCADMNGEYHTGEDISLVDKNAIPDHTLLVGGFPCQDYSVARTLSSSQGIEGKKGVLWWQIRDTLIAKKPPFCIFENVDRLLKSPAKQRGRDFGIILACLAEEGYSVEWRVVNAAQYGAAQRRRRTFIFAYRNDSTYGKEMAAYIDRLYVGWRFEQILISCFAAAACLVILLSGVGIVRKGQNKEAGISYLMELYELDPENCPEEEQKRVYQEYHDYRKYAEDAIDDVLERYAEWETE